MRRPSGSGLWWQVGAMVAVLVVVAATMTFAVRDQCGADPDKVDCTKVKCVALTFDDGPSPFTDRLLDVLNAETPRRRSS